MEGLISRRELLGRHSKNVVKRGPATKRSSQSQGWTDGGPHWDLRTKQGPGRNLGNKCTARGGGGRGGVWSDHRAEGAFRYLSTTVTSRSRSFHRANPSQAPPGWLKVIFPQPHVEREARQHMLGKSHRPELNSRLQQRLDDLGHVTQDHGSLVSSSETCH